MLVDHNSVVMILVEVGGLGGCAVEIEHRQEKGDGRREEGGRVRFCSYWTWINSLACCELWPRIYIITHSVSVLAVFVFPLLVHSHIRTSVMSRIHVKQ